MGGIQDDNDCLEGEEEQSTAVSDTVRSARASVRAQLVALLHVTGPSPAWTSQGSSLRNSSRS